MENNNVSIMDFLFDKELKVFEHLQKTIYEEYEMLKQADDEKIRYILQQNIMVARSQIFVMMDILSQCKDAKIKRSYEEKLDGKLIELDEIYEKALKKHNK